jgi:hypothetical protein
MAPSGDVQTPASLERVHLSLERHRDPLGPAQVATEPDHGGGRVAGADAEASGQASDEAD